MSELKTYAVGWQLHYGGQCVAITDAEGEVAIRLSFLYDMQELTRTDMEEIGIAARTELEKIINSK